MRRAWFGVAPVVLLFGAVALMMLGSPVQGEVRASAVREAESEGWREAGSPESTRAGPLGLVRIETSTFERYATSTPRILLGKFFVVSLKSPVWLPSGVLTGLVDDYLVALAAEEKVSLTRVNRGTSFADSVVLEYDGRTSQGSLFGEQDLGVLARIMPCDLQGNVVIGAGFATTRSPTGGLLGGAENVYAEEVKAILAPAVACP